ncbi:MAG: hypothetical protein DWQ42_03485 [Planctomycetota bacterium]|nr:MAG: hypothetical protein DWQ42_03485 [Planctomycetota bacterium]
MSFRFRLRTLFVVSIVLAIPIAWIGAVVREARLRERILHEIERRGGTVTLVPPSEPLSLAGQVRRQLCGEKAAATVWKIDLFGKHIQDQDLAVLEDLGHVNGLSLQGTRVTDAGIHKLGVLSTLRYISLESTEISNAGIDVLVERLPELEYVDLSGTRVSDAVVPIVARLQKLRSLDLSDTNLQQPDFEALHGLPGLTGLRLSAPKGAMHLERLPSLEILDVRLVHSSQSVRLVQIPKIRKLSIASSEIHLEHLGALRELTIYDSSFEEFTISHLPNLEALKLVGSHVDQGALAELVACSKLREITLDTCTFALRDLGGLSAYKNLERVVLEGPGIAEDDVRDLRLKLSKVQVEWRPPSEKPLLREDR